MSYKDPKKQKEYVRRWNIDHRLERRSRQQRRRLEAKQFVDTLKTSCVICGYKRCTRALHFHHTENDKVEIISKAVRDMWSKPRLLAEIKKCELLCSNCHMEKHCTNEC